YVALGHLHRPQRVAGPRGTTVAYSGSPLKYSFAEADHPKGATLVELLPGASETKSSGRFTVTTRSLRLTPRRELSQLHGPIGELLESPEHEAARADYVEAVVKLRAGEYLLDA